MKRTRWIKLALTLGVVTSFLVEKPIPLANAGPAQAPVRSPILGDYIGIWVDNVDNLFPAVAYNSRHDEYLVAFYNDRGSTRDIYARRIGGDGSLKTWFTVASGTNQVNWLPVIAYSPVQDEYLIVYTHADPTPGSTFDIWARRIKWDGSDLNLPAYAPFPISTEADDQWNAQVAYNDQRDEYLVVYQNDWSSGRKDIAAQRVRASDGKLLSWSNIATGANQWRVGPHVAYNAARNEYLIAYNYWSSPFTEGDVHAKIISFDMGMLSSEIYISDGPDDQVYASVAAGPDEYLVVWANEETGTLDGYDILGRRIDGNGTLQGTGGFPIAGIGDVNLYEAPAVAYSSLLGYLVAWDHDVDPGPVFVYDVSGRYVMAGQDQAYGDRVDIDNSNYWQITPDLACDDRGNCLVVYEDDWPVGTTGDFEIRGRFVSPHRFYLPLMKQ
jgi:hypothetical protein